MKNKFLSKIHKTINRNNILSIFVSLILFGSVPVVLAWTAPTATPPNGNVAAPINVGIDTQLREGFLNLYGPRAGLGVSKTSDYTVPGSLLVGVNGHVGAEKYCNKTGTFCRSIEELAGITNNTTVINNTTNTGGTCKYEQRTSNWDVNMGTGDGGLKVVEKELAVGTWTVSGSGQFYSCGSGCYTIGAQVAYTKNGIYPKPAPVSKTNPARIENLFVHYSGTIGKKPWVVPTSTFTLSQPEKIRVYIAQGYINGALTLTGPQLICE